jgi:SAM-dependent MidA family methyltransferase
MTGDHLYDPEARRDTPLALKLKAQIKAHGPITVGAYMSACLDDPELGYYRTQAAIGAGGDFITAPEISQVFGEVIGLWCAVVWHQMGSPSVYNLIELGPGRGTLMSDMLRATKRVPGFAEAMRLHLVESSARLLTIQRAAMERNGVAATWHDDLGSIPAGPAIIVGNEFLDVLSANQFLRDADGWKLRGVEVDAQGRLEFCTLPLTEVPDWLPARSTDSIGAVIETVDYKAFCKQLAVRGAPTAALFMDYGHDATHGADTMQAVRAHKPEHPLTSPGEADLTTHVHFGAVASAAKTVGLATDGPITQAEFLGSLGVLQRGSKLMAANPGKANEIEMSIARLMAPQGMGTRFKAIGIRTPTLPALPGFAEHK